MLGTKGQRFGFRRLSQSRRGDDGDVGWVSDGSTASGLSPPPVPSTRAPPRAGARRSGLTAPCAPPRAESSGNGPARSFESKQFLPCCCSSTFFRARHIFELTRTASGALEATRTGFHRGAVARISRVETRGGSIANVAGARRDKRGAAEATQRGGVSRKFVRSRHGKQRARGPRARPSQQGVRGRAGVRRGVGTSHALQRHRLPRLGGGAEAPAQAHAGARCAPPIIDRAP